MIPENNTTVHQMSIGLHKKYVSLHKMNMNVHERKSMTVYGHIYYLYIFIYVMNNLMYMHVMVH